MFDKVTSPATLNANTRVFVSLSKMILFSQAYLGLFSSMVRDVIVEGKGVSKYVDMERPSEVVFAGIINSVIFVPAKALLPIAFKLLPKVTLQRLLQFSNADPPNVNKAFGSVTSVKLVHPWNALTFIPSRASPKFNVAKLVHPLNADSPIVLIPTFRFIVASFEQPEKLLLPISNVVVGNVTTSSEVQPKNALSLISVIPSPNDMFLKAEHPEN